MKPLPNGEVFYSLALKRQERQERISDARMAGGSRFFGVFGSLIYHRVVRRHSEKVVSTLAAVDL
jgi:hypothetical protein